MNYFVSCPNWKYQNVSFWLFPYPNVHQDQIIFYFYHIHICKLNFIQSLKYLINHSKGEFVFLAMLHMALLKKKKKSKSYRPFLNVLCNILSSVFHFWYWMRQASSVINSLIMIKWTNDSFMVHLNSVNSDFWIEKNSELL